MADYRATSVSTGMLRMNAVEGSTATRHFLDTNVLLYVISEDHAKADVAEDLLEGGGTVSVQVLNEFASVAIRKLGLQFSEVQELLAGVRHFCRVEPLTTDTHELGLAYFNRFGYSVYDSMILAAATLADCRVIMTEDMQAGQQVTDSLVIRNPFAVV